MKKSVKICGILLILLMISSCSVMVKDFEGLIKDYSVEFYADGISSDDIDYTTPIAPTVQTVTGVKPQEYTVLEIPGFTYNDRNFITLADGKHTLQVLYKRNIITYNFDAAGGALSNADGSTSESKEVKGKFGAALSVEKPERYEYRFDGWMIKGTEDIVPLPQTFETSGKDYVAHWTLANTPYTIEYYYEDATGSGDLSLVEHKGLKYKKVKTENVKGVLGENSDVESDGKAELVLGYLKPEVENTLIKENDDTDIAKVWYERASVTYTFKANGGKMSNGVAYEEKTGKIGSGLTPPADPTRDECTFDCWDKTIPSTFEESAYPAGDTFTAYWKVTYTFKPTNGKWADNSTDAKTAEGRIGSELTFNDEPVRDDCKFAGWNPTKPEVFGNRHTEFEPIWNSKYTIKYLYEDASVSPAQYVEATSERQEQYAEVGSITNVQAAEKPGYEAPKVENAQITANGQAVVNVKYERASVTYTFDAAGGKWGEGTSETGIKTVTGKIGSGLTPPDDPTYDLRIFDCWDKTVPTTFEESAASTGDTFTAYWKAEFKFSAGSGQWADGSKEKTEVGRIGSAVTLSFSDSPTLTGFVFTGWNNEVPTTFDKNRGFIPVWKVLSTPGVTDTLKDDITLTAQASGYQIHVKCTTPYNADGWTYTWSLNGKECSDITTSDFMKMVDKYDTYTISVMAKDGNKPALLKQIKVLVDGNVNNFTN